METDTPTPWPVRRRMPDLATLDTPTRAAVTAAVAHLRTLRDTFADRFLTLARRHVPGYEVLPDDEIRTSARRFMDTLVSELSDLRVPDAALREMLRAHAVERAARGVPLDALAVGYQLGSREMLALFDEVGAAVGLPAELLLAVHDSTWEFSNEASSVFAGVQHELAVERAHFDAERRSAFAAGVLGGAFPADRVHHDAHLFGLDPHADHVALAAKAATALEADAVRRALATALRVPAERLLLAPVGPHLGFIAPKAPAALPGHLLAVGPALPLDRLDASFQEARLALDTAEHFAMTGLVRLADLGPRPLVLPTTRTSTATGLTERHLTALGTGARSSADIEETTRAYLAHDQDVTRTAHHLAVHPNTVRYRVNRFQQLTGLDLRTTEDLVTTWWLLNRRRPPSPPRG